ncbi:MAG: hypothetical protein M1832_004437 [Thelocarpon impressellum]|nr:MAG: hypothetical protein M1832_004437 [Thelocarpon impressellum]
MLSLTPYSPFPTMEEIWARSRAYLTPFERLIERSHLALDMVTSEYTPAFSHNTPGEVIRDLLEHEDLLAMRLTSHATKEWIDRALLPAIFRAVFAQPRVDGLKRDFRPPKYKGLEMIARYAVELVVRVGDYMPNPMSYAEMFGKDLQRQSPSWLAGPADIPGARARAPSVISVAPLPSGRPRTVLAATPDPALISAGVPGVPRIATTATHWTDLLHQLPKVTTLTIVFPATGISSPYDSDAAPFLRALRTCFEQIRCGRIATLQLLPITLLGFMYLKWHRGGSFGSPDWMPGTAWSRINSLRVKCVAPRDSTLVRGSGLRADERRSAAKVLHDVLASFGRTLDRLDWTWDGRQGPCVMFLDQTPYPATFSAPPIIWHSLRFAHFDNADLTVKQVRQLFEARAPALRYLRLHGGVRTLDDEPDQWRVLEDMGVVWHLTVEAHEFWRASGFAEPRPVDEGDVEYEDIPIWLDLRGLSLGERRAASLDRRRGVVSGPPTVPGRFGHPWGRAGPGRPSTFPQGHMSPDAAARATRAEQQDSSSEEIFQFDEDDDEDGPDHGS